MHPAVRLALLALLALIWLSDAATQRPPGARTTNRRASDLFTGAAAGQCCAGQPTAAESAVFRLDFKNWIRPSQPCDAKAVK